MTPIEQIGTLDPGKSGPRYIQLQRLIHDAVVAGRLKAKDGLPSERDLCLHYDLSRVTVRKAIDGLVADGMVVRRQGAGTFVAASATPQLRVEKSFELLTSFSEDMTARGRVPKSRWIARSTGQVTPEEALSLGLSPGSAVYRFHRLRFADGMPMALEYSAIVGDCLPSAEAVADSLYAALEQAGNRPVRALQRLRAMAFPKEKAALLDVPAGHAGLLIERRSFLRDGRTVEYTQSYYRGDAYDLVAELTEL